MGFLLESPGQLADSRVPYLSTPRGALQLGRANVLQNLFAQSIGIAFTGFGKRDELRGNRSFDVIVAVSGPQSDGDHFECNA
jgi:hypothetical protein